MNFTPEEIWNEIGQLHMENSKLKGQVAKYEEFIKANFKVVATDAPPAPALASETLPVADAPAAPAPEVVPDPTPDPVTA